MLALHVVLGFATALVLTIVAIPLIIKFASTYGLYDVPEILNVDQYKNTLNIKRRIHGSPIPRLGGLAIVFGFFITNLIWSFGTDLYPALATSVIVFLIGFLDDISSLSAKFRLTTQTMCASFAVWSSGLAVNTIAFSPQFSIALPNELGFALAVFIVVGAINAVNMIDGLDGLAGGIVLIAVALLSFVYFLRTHETQLLLYISIPMVGAIVGFLRYNTHPAAIFMGDGGSNWLGYMTGIFILIVLNDFIMIKGSGSYLLTTTSSIKGASQLPILSVILCLAVPIFDTAFVMISRLREGQNPMKADKRHFHHSLLKLGFSHSQSVTSVYFVALAIGIMAIIPIVFPQYGFGWLPYAALFVLLLVISIMRSDKPYVEKLILKRIAWRQDQVIGHRFRIFLKYWDMLNRYLIYTILLVSPVFMGVLRDEIGYAALTAGILLICSIVFRWKKDDFLDSMILCLGAVVLLVANNQNYMNVEIVGHRHNIQFIYNGLFVFLFISTIVLLLFTAKKRYFVFTPSDFLLLSLPMILLLVPEPIQSEFHLNIICLRSLVVFMALRSIVKRRQMVTYHLRMVTIIALTIVVLISIFKVRVVY